MIRKFFIILALTVLSVQTAFAASKSQTVDGQIALACKPEEVCIAAFRPIQTTLVVTLYKESKKAKVVDEVDTDENGTFSLKLKPGVYSFSISPLATATAPFSEEFKGSDLYITNGSVKVSRGLSTSVFLESLSNK